MNYYDNFEKINPVVDKPIRAPMTNIDDTQRMKTEEEFDQDLAKLMENLPASEQEGVKMFEEFDREPTTHNGKGGGRAQSSFCYGTHDTFALRRRRRRRSS